MLAGAHENEIFAHMKINEDSYSDMSQDNEVIRNRQGDRTTNSRKTHLLHTTNINILHSIHTDSFTACVSDSSQDNKVVGKHRGDHTFSSSHTSSRKSTTHKYTSHPSFPSLYNNIIYN